MSRFDAKGPMDAMLQKAQGRIRFHMPGHKGRMDPFDMTELSATDDLYAPQGAIREAERLAAVSCGAASSIMLTGGSTAGLLAMILSSVAPGETLLLPRNVHHAVLSACVWGDIEAVFVEDPLAAFAGNPHVRAVLVTRPDYYGRCLDLVPLVAMAHDQDALVLVDEAHGAHFPWWDAPASAGLLGADAWVQSSHKTLPALTGAAWLHLAETLNGDRARRFLRMAQTSSPPFPILASLDNARQWMDVHGAQALETLLGGLAAFRAQLGELSGYRDVLAEDPTRLVIDTRGRGLSGLDCQAQLSAQGVEIEMADDACIVCICTVADTQADVSCLLEALASIPQGTPLPPVSMGLPTPGQREMSARGAVLSPQEAVPLADAAGRIASISAGMYPPGVPAVLPGEIITPAAVEWLLSLPMERRFGVEHGALICVK